MKLDEYRKTIDEIDKNIVALLKKRERIVKKIKSFKEKFSIPVVDKKREKEIFDRVERLAKKYNLNKDFLKRFFRLIINHSRNIQKNGKG